MILTRADPSKLHDVRWVGLAGPWVALFLMDRLYYHELLRASVQFAQRIEVTGKAPALCTALTTANRRLLYGRVKVSLFYWLPVAGLTYAAVGGWQPWGLWAIPFVTVEIAAALVHWVAERRATAA